MLTLLILKLLQSPAFPLHASTQHLNTINEMFSQLLLYSFLITTIYQESPSHWDNLWQSALLHYNENILLLTSPEVSFLATTKVVPGLLAPETGDMTQVLPRIQSTSLPGLFCSNQGFYFLWVILHFLCREFY